MYSFQHLSLSGFTAMYLFLLSNSYQPNCFLMNSPTIALELHNTANAN